jgi:hypothetical protein
MTDSSLKRFVILPVAGKGNIGRTESGGMAMMDKMNKNELINFFLPENPDDYIENSSRVKLRPSEKAKIIGNSGSARQIHHRRHSACLETFIPTGRRKRWKGAMNAMNRGSFS